MKKRLISRITAFSATLLLFSGLPEAAAVEFADVSESYWAKKEISYVTDQGLFNGTTETTFSPEAPMKRGQLAAVLYRYAGSPQVVDPHVFARYADVDPDSYYASACQWANETGVFMNEQLVAKELHPNEAITRSEFATMLYNFARQQGKGATTDRVTGYEDMQSVSDVIQNSMLAWAVPNGIMNGISSTTMNPFGGIKRSHVAAMLYRYEHMEVETNAPIAPEKPVTPEKPEKPAKPETAGNVYGANEQIPFEVGHYKAQIAIGEKIYVGAEALGCDDEYMVEKTMDMKGLGAVGKVAGKTTLFVPEMGNPQNKRWITVELTITEKSGSSVTPEKPSSDDDFREIREEIVRLTNEERAKEGLTLLEIDEKLMEAAQIRANEMLQSYSHTRPDGRKCFSVLDDMELPYTVCAENIGIDGSAYGHVSGWMNSAGHKKNIMNQSTKKIGVGYIIDISGNSRCVQLFTD